MMKKFLTFLYIGFAFLIVATVIVEAITFSCLKPTVETLEVSFNPLDKVQYLDRNGVELSRTYKTKWNVSNQVDLNSVPTLLLNGLIFVEDQRFYKHHGIDWLARFKALWQSIKAGRIVRGGSTITEQVIKIIEDRPRTFWNKWLEGFEAYRVENKFSKTEILNFYLNQVPYARNIRGIKNASRYYFNRDLSVLTPRETLAIITLIRSPSRLDPKKSLKQIENVIDRTALFLYNANKISKLELDQIQREKLELQEGIITTDATHFIQHLTTKPELIKYARDGQIRTTIEASLQDRTKRALETQIERLKEQNVKQGAALVVDLVNNEILAWVVAGDFYNDEAGQIDAVRILRQPGSTLKPFLYATALEKNSNGTNRTASTIIQDAPLSEAINQGIHRYRNFSGLYYGPLRLRIALANSLNTPAVRTVKYVGEDKFLEKLHLLGFEHLTKESSHYGAGLALGNGEVSLFELVRAFSVLARRGVYQDFNYVHQASPTPEHQVYQKESVDIINDILADPEARTLEFGRSSLYQFPEKVAFKTGTSSDFRDAWVVGYSSRYVAGVWLGNYNREMMKRVSGSIGPMAVLKVIFGMLSPLEGLKENDKLEHHHICAISGELPGKDCPQVEEIYIKGTAPVTTCNGEHKIEEKLATTLEISYPLDKMTFAIDVRIPITEQVLYFQIKPQVTNYPVEWWLDGHNIGTSNEPTGKLPWQLQLGKHHLQAVQYKQTNVPSYSQEIEFVVVK